MKSQFISVMLGFFLKYLAKTPHSGYVCRRKTVWDASNIFSTVLFKFQPKFSSEAREYHAIGNPKIRLKASNQSLSNSSLFSKHLCAFYCYCFKMPIFFSEHQCRCLFFNIQIPSKIITIVGLSSQSPFCYQAATCFLKSYIGHVSHLI